MKKTGLFGGSFNPIHNGHISLARNILNQGVVDEIWFMVSPQNPFKQQADLLNDEKRLELARVALEGETGMTASDYEFRLPRPSYTWNTLQNLSRDYPEREFHLLIGGDNWFRFNQWFHGGDIVANYQIIIYPRGNSEINPDTLPPNVTLVDTPLYDISSTDIRRRLQAGESIADLVPQCVNDIIIREKLYLQNS